jgi:hypothetical protein
LLFAGDCLLIMKTCPECNSTFPDTNKFCDLDGTPLVGEAAEGSWKDNWKILVIAAAGVAVGVALFVVYQLMTRQPSSPTSNQAISNQAVTQQAPVMTLTPPVSDSASPSPSPSPSPRVTPTPAVAAAPTPVQLSSSPLSTGGKSGAGGFTIRLTNGTTVEADDAWETKEGIWYRRHGIVTLLPRKDVQAIEKPTPTPSPTPSPVASP